jgi:sirohydrochlorin cobaltochelatase
VASVQCEWGRDALLLIGHGAPRFTEAGRILEAHADTLRRRGCFADVATGWLNGGPSAAEALASVSSRVVHVVPFFMENGWFVRQGVPAALRGVDRVLCFHPPVGVHPDMAVLAAARVERACGSTAGVSVLLIGHGSARSPGRRMALHRHAEWLEGTGRFARACAAFLEEPPFVADALADWRAEPVAVLGFFSGEGGHVRDGLGRLLRTECARRGVAGAILIDLGLIVDDPGMPKIILQQVAAGPDHDVI